MLKTIAAAVLALCACACASQRHAGIDPTIETNQTYNDGEYK